MSAISTPVSSTVSSSSTASTSGLLDNTEIASNFTTFLQLLTTQLQNQDPLSPMDTNQFTQQLVQFAGVEQQMKSNDQLATLVSLQQNAQTTEALAMVGATVVVNGATAPFTTTVAPTMANASVVCAFCCSDTRVASWSFDFICCSTPANWTSCCVN